jgi:DNA repair protein RadC
VDKEKWQKKGAGHRGRLRDRFLEHGLAGFSDAEVLELLLSFGTPRRDCKEPARNLLKECGSLAAVLDASQSSLQKIHGIGPKNGFAIHFVQAVARRYLKQRLLGKTYLRSSQQVKEYLVHSMRGLKKEIFAAIFLDSSHAILESEIISEGTVNINTVYPRELVARALEVNASALIIAHNHPSGSLKPSPQDLHLTQKLAMICSIMQIQLLDHIIIGDGFYSFADHGLMTKLKEKSRKIVDGAETISR